MSNHATHNLGRILPLATQRLTTNHQTTHSFNLSTAYLSSSSFSIFDSNTIDIKETNQINYYKRTQHPLHYPTYYRHIKYSSYFNLHATKHNFTECENNNRNSHNIRQTNHIVTNKLTSPYPSTMYIPNTIHHNTQTFEKHQKSSILQLTQISQ